MLQFAGVLGLSDSFAAQETLRSWNLNVLNDRFPTSLVVDSLPDLDKDGFRELLVGDPNWSPPSYDKGRVFVWSGLNNTILWEVRGTAGEDLGRVVATVGDMNGDAFPDVAAANGGHVSGTFILDGRDGTVLYESPIFTSCMAPMGDLNGDRLADVLFNSSAGSVILLGGSFEYLDETPPLTGSTCVRLGDLDGDGMDDFAVGRPTGGFNYAGEVYVFSSREGKLLHYVVGQNSFCEFGRAVAGPGDLTGDGVPDFVVGEPSGGYCVIGFDGGLFFYDGLTGALVEDMPGIDNGVNFELGLRIAPAGDVNGNGIGDLLVYHYPFLVRLIDGATRESSYVMPGSIGPPFRGDDIDWNGDDFPDFLIGRYEAPNQILRLYSGAPTGVSVLGRACSIARGEEGPRIGATGSPVIGADYRIHLSGVDPGKSVLFLMGDLAAGGRAASRFAGCSPLVSPTAVSPMTTTEVSPGKGVATTTVPIPPDAAAIGTSFHVQWLVLDPSGTAIEAATRVLRIEVQAP